MHCQLGEASSWIHLSLESYLFTLSYHHLCCSKYDHITNNMPTDHTPFGIRERYV